MTVRSDAWFAILVLGLVVIWTFTPEIKGALNRVGVSATEAAAPALKHPKD